MRQLCGRPSESHLAVSIPSEVGRGRAHMSTAGCDIRVHTSIRFNPLGGGAGSGSTWSSLVSMPSDGGWLESIRCRFNPLGGGAGSGSMTFDKHNSSGRRVSIPSEVGRGRTLACSQDITEHHRLRFQSPRRWGGVGLRMSSQVRPIAGRCTRFAFQSPRRWGGVGLSGRCNDWPDMSLGSGFPYPPENGTKLGSLSLAPGSPGKRKRREQNRLGQVVTGARNRVNQGYEIRQSKKRRARPPRSGTGTRPGARRKPETRRGPVHSPRNGASKAGGVREPRR